MKQTILLDTAIRDYIFIPLILIMIIVSLLRMNLSKSMNSKDSPLLKPTSLTRYCLKNTLFQHYGSHDAQRPFYREKLGTQQEVEAAQAVAKVEKDEDNTVYKICQGVNLKELVDEADENKRHGQALARSRKIRVAANYLPEESVKKRKAIFCTEKTGVLCEEIVTNPMAAMQNPDMMSGMLKGNLQGIMNIALFQGVGSIFQGFIIAKVPFVLGQKFKGTLQQGFNLALLEPSYVSSMSWCFLLVFGLSGFLSLLIKDTSGMEEMTQSPQMGMMQAQGGGGGGMPGQPQDFGGAFKSEKGNYELLSYKHKLDDVEDALLLKWRES